MAYNGGFPATYPQFYPQYNTPQQLNNYQAPQQNSGMIWVQGIEAAKAYQIAPGVTLPLWDSDAQVIYLKTCDAAGMPSMRVIDYTIRTEPTRKAQNALSGAGGTIPTMQDLNSLQDQIDALKRKLEDLTGGQNEPAIQRAQPVAAESTSAAVSTVPAAVSG